LWSAYHFSEILIDYLSFRTNIGKVSEEEQSTFFQHMPKLIPLVRLAVVFIALASTSALAQTYVYTYTGNYFTSVANPPNPPPFPLGPPYTTSDKVTGSITFSAPLGADYAGNPSATMLSYNFTDGVGPQNAVGPPLTFPYLYYSTFATDSSGNIVSWNFEVNTFTPTGIESKTIQTENDSGGVVDSGNLDYEGLISWGGSVTSNPGVWVLTIVPEPSVGLLFVSFAALVLAFGRFRRSLLLPGRGMVG
jgi:hypothetical protein